MVSLVATYSPSSQHRIAFMIIADHRGWHRLFRPQTPEGRESHRHYRQQRLCIGSPPGGAGQCTRYGLVAGRLKGIEAGGQAHGVGADRCLSQSRWRVRFQGESQSDLQCGDDSEHQGESAQSYKAQAWAQAVVQCCDSCVTGARRADVCVGGQIQAVAAPFRAYPAAPLRDEIDGVYLDPPFRTEALIVVNFYR